MRGRSPVGINDVAEAAGVSITTVSHALSGKGRISEATKARVTKAATELGYRPNQSAQRLVSGASGLIALCAGSSSAPGGRLTSSLPDYPFIMTVAMSASVEAV